MFMPYDKLFGNVEKAILQSQGLNVYEAVFPDKCVIEFLVKNQDIYLKMSSSVEKYNKLDHPHLLKIYHWSYEFLLTQNEKIYTQPKDRIYSFGILIAMIAVLYDSDEEEPVKSSSCEGNGEEIWQGICCFD